MPRTAPSAGCPDGAIATGATSATAQSPLRTRSSTDVQNTSRASHSGPVTGVAAITKSSAAAVQHAAHESATARHSSATGRRSSSRAHTVTTASAMPSANQTKKRGGHRPSRALWPGQNIAAVYGNDRAPYTPMAISSRFARTPTSGLRVRSAHQPRTDAVAGSVVYQPTSTARLHSWPSSDGPSGGHHWSGMKVWVRVSSAAHVTGSVMWSRPAVTM